jgi:hypothetical protein
MVLSLKINIFKLSTTKPKRMFSWLVRHFSVEQNGQVKLQTLTEEPDNGTVALAICCVLCQDFQATDLNVLSNSDANSLDQKLDYDYMVNF